MKVVVEYHGQMRAAMGCAREEIEVQEGCTVGQIMKAKNLSGLKFVRGTQANEETVLRDRDVLVLLSPIAGG
jgi:molybdopterin converting factor small subunit